MTEENERERQLTNAAERERRLIARERRFTKAAGRRLLDPGIEREIYRATTDEFDANVRMGPLERRAVKKSQPFALRRDSSAAESVRRAVTGTGRRAIQLITYNRGNLQGTVAVERDLVKALRGGASDGRSLAQLSMLFSSVVEPSKAAYDVVLYRDSELDGARPDDQRLFYRVELKMPVRPGVSPSVFVAEPVTLRPSSALNRLHVRRPAFRVVKLWDPSAMDDLDAAAELHPRELTRFEFAWVRSRRMGRFIDLPGRTQGSGVVLPVDEVKDSVVEDDTVDMGSVGYQAFVASLSDEERRVLGIDDAAVEPAPPVPVDWNVVIDSFAWGDEVDNALGFHPALTI